MDESHTLTMSKQLSSQHSAGPHKRQRPRSDQVTYNHRSGGSRYLSNQSPTSCFGDRVSSTKKVEKRASKNSKRNSPRLINEMLLLEEKEKQEMIEAALVDKGNDLLTSQQI